MNKAGKAGMLLGKDLCAKRELEAAEEKILRKPAFKERDEGPLRAEAKRPLCKEGVRISEEKILRKPDFNEKKKEAAERTLLAERF